MSDLECVEQISSVFRQTRLLSDEVRNSLPGDVLFLLGLLAQDVEIGAVQLLTATDSDAFRASIEFNKLNASEPIRRSTTSKILLVDLTPEGFVADRSEFHSALESADVVVGFGGKGDHVRLQFPTVGSEMPLRLFPSCRWRARTTSTGIPLLDVADRDPVVSDVLELATTASRFVEPTALITQARLIGCFEARENVEALRSQILHLTLEAAGLRDATIGAEATVGTLKWRIDRLNAHVNHLQTELEIARRTNDQILRSRTFRLGRMMTAPLRVVRKLAKKLR